MVAIFILFSNG